MNMTAGKKKNSKLKAQDGIIIIVALVILLVVSTLIIGFLSYVNNGIKATSKMVDYAKATYIAEAGFVKAAYDYAFKAVTTADYTESFPDGKYRIYIKSPYIWSYGYYSNNALVAMWAYNPYYSSNVIILGNYSESAS